MSYLEIAKYFLKLGFTGFGGPVALIQQMRIDLVENLNPPILTESEFDQAFTMIKAMPGPIAFQMAVYIGQVKKKFWGGFIAGLGIILPSFFMMILLAIFYNQVIHNNYLSQALLGAQYAVAGIITVGLYKLSKNFHQKKIFWILFFLAGFLYYFKLAPESVLIIFSGLLLVGYSKFKNKLFSISVFPLFVFDQDKIFNIFAICFKAGALVFGTGLAAFPFLQRAFVNELGWLDLKTFNDAVSLGQLTPGPVTISAAFMGYKMADFYGAIAAVIGLYLPAFIHISTWFPKALSWLSKQTWVNDFILGSAAAVVSCVLITLYHMNLSEITKPFFWIIFVGSVFIQFRWKNLSILKIIAFGILVSLFSTFL